MVAASLTYIFLIFLLLQVGNSSAQPHQGEKKPLAFKEIMIRLTESSLMKLKEEIDGISATSGLKNTRPGGRKMMVKTVFSNEQQVKMDILSAENSGVAHFVGICNNKEKGSSKPKCKLSHRRKFHPVKSKYVGFTAFSADYHVSKSHPPKNN